MKHQFHSNKGVFDNLPIRDIALDLVNAHSCKVRVIATRQTANGISFFDQPGDNRAAKEPAAAGH